MASNGGVFSLDEARRQPVQLVESGPVGGCIGAAAYARALGLDKVIAFDMGGTTAKCALIESGAFETRSPYYVGGPELGFPIRGAVVDIVEVGAGGGSIAGLDRQLRLTVGPASAGSTPGPACYGLGGSEPTITDANVLLGRIGEDSFLSGEMTLDGEASRAAIRGRIALPLGYGDDRLDHVAQGILDIGALTMSSAIAKITTERGLDPRDFSLFVFGGGGPVHGVDLARHIGIPRVIVPPQPGVFSAVGMLLAEARIDETRTFLRPLDETAVAEMAVAFAAMEAAATARLPPVETTETSATAERYAEIRHKGQRHAMKTTLGAVHAAQAVRDAFTAAYRARFGHVDPAAPLELVSLGVTVSRPMGEFTPASLAPATDKRAHEPRFRNVFFKQVDGRLETPVLFREELAPGDERTGPLVVEEYGSSTIVGPGDRLTVGVLGELVVEIKL
jgi:N-methylhydantoinase A